MQTDQSAAGQEAKFSASYDRVTMILSVGLCSVLLFVAVATHNLFVLVPVVLLFGITYGYSPRAYTVFGKTIIVKRLLGDVRISLENVRELRPVTREDYRGCIRLFGSGGLFGYYGVFRTSRLGLSTWYMAHRKNAVVLITEKKTTLYSPDDVEGFFAAIRVAVPVPPTENRIVDPSSGGIGWRAGSRRSLWMVFIALGVGALGALAALLAWLNHRMP